MRKPVTRKDAVDCLLHRFILYANTAITCGICQQPLLPGQRIEFDHIHSVVMGGEHNYQNLRPVHYECHKRKSAQDVAAISKVKRILKGGKAKRGKPMPSRPFPKQKRPFRRKIDAR